VTPAGQWTPDACLPAGEYNEELRMGRMELMESNG
jgi:hypothetical protein